MGERLAVIADDLTGAADTAVAFATPGPAVILLDSAHDLPAVPCVAIDTDTRARTAAEAAARTAQAAGLAARAGFSVYKKIDSLLRGHVAIELAATARAVADVRGTRVLTVLAPAFPAAGRTTVDGLTYVHGVPLATRLDLTGRTVRRAGLTEVRAGLLPALLAKAAAVGSDLVLVDAEQATDLAAIAAAARTIPDVVLAGSGGLARHLHPAAPAAPPRLDVDGPVLLLVGSAHEVARAQSAALAGLVTPVVLGDEGALAAALDRGEDVLVTPDPAEPVRPERAGEIAAALGSGLAAHGARIGALVATGGDTARAALVARGLDRARVVGELEPGVVLLDADGLPVVTKSGAFGDENTMVRVLRRLREGVRQPWDVR
ncbi:MAG TPA: four-carbon acid sugar kinase family protein [Pseudonocardiaceae bacterium]|nr:four-carbon acid sugar kinase family protein [Pseudonocardiaceae bacterium]